MKVTYTKDPVTSDWHPDNIPLYYYIVGFGMLIFILWNTGNCFYGMDDSDAKK